MPTRFFLDFSDINYIFSDRRNHCSEGSKGSRQERATPNRPSHITGKRRVGNASRINMCQWCSIASCLGFPT